MTIPYPRALTIATIAIIKRLEFLAEALEPFKEEEKNKRNF
jgi:hypothetical protein